jgi:hypothetical protein
MVPWVWNDTVVGTGAAVVVTSAVVTLRMLRCDLLGLASGGTPSQSSYGRGE